MIENVRQWFVDSFYCSNPRNKSARDLAYEYAGLGPSLFLIVDRIAVYCGYRIQDPARLPTLSGKYI